MFSSGFIRITILVALGAVCVVAQTQQPSPATTRSEASSTGAITGRVVDESGQPLPNAIVSVRGTGPSNSQQAVATDREGSFQVNGLEQSLSYYVTAITPAYMVLPPEQGAAPLRPYRVGDNVTLTLIKGGVITGTVVNASGDPLVGIRVRAQLVRLRNGRRIASGQTWDRETDDRGVYRLYGLPPGSYVIMAGGAANHWSSSGIDPYDTDVPTYAPSATRDTAIEISVRPGEETTGVDIRYRGEQGRFVSGVVAGASEGFNVTLTPVREGGSLENSSAQPEMSGQNFSFIGVADGDYDLVAFSYSPNREYGVSETKRIRVRGADVTGIELTARPLGSVAGRVVLEETKAPECAGKPSPPFAEMTVGGWHNDSETAKEIPQSVWSFGVPVKPDPQGNFVVRNLAPGEYYFSARLTTKYWHVASIQFAPPPASTTKKPVDATRFWTKLKFGERREGLTVTLVQGGASFRAQVDPGEGEQGSARTFVYLAPVERERADNPLSYFGTQVTPDGKVTMNGIAPGRYWISTQTITDDAPAPLLRMRFPHESETRAQLRRDAEAGKTEIGFKPCDDVTDFKLPLNR